jgi:ribosome-binding protein aMBF1 (putative translation factor)
LTGLTLTAVLIKESRVAQGLSQTDLAKRCGYNNGQFVSNIERGIAFVPPEKASVFASALKIKLQMVVDAYVRDCESEYKKRMIAA